MSTVHTYSLAQRYRNCLLRRKCRRNIASTCVKNIILQRRCTDNSNSTRRAFVKTMFGTISKQHLLLICEVEMLCLFHGNPPISSFFVWCNPYPFALNATNLLHFCCHQAPCKSSGGFVCFSISVFKTSSLNHSNDGQGRSGNMEIKLFPQDGRKYSVKCLLPERNCGCYM